MCIARVRACVSVYVLVYFKLRMCMNIYVCVCEYMFACVNISMCVCVGVQVNDVYASEDA